MLKEDLDRIQTWINGLPTQTITEDGRSVQVVNAEALRAEWKAIRQAIDNK